MYPQVHPTQHYQEGPERDEDGIKLRPQLVGVVIVELYIEPDVPGHVDTEEGVV